MASKKVFSDFTRSRLADIYNLSSESLADDVIKSNVKINLFDKDVTFNDIQDTLKKQPFITTSSKNFDLNLNDFDYEAIQKTKKYYNSIPSGAETVKIEMCQVEKFDEVKFIGAETICIDNKRRYGPPRFVIDLTPVADQITGHQGVRINTGYVINIPSITVGKTISGNKIVDTTKSQQLDFVIIPQIVSNHDGLIPNIYARDADDTGLFTINFTVTEKFNARTHLQIVLNAYSCIRPISVAQLIDVENKANELFKAKDNRTGRWVKNPKTKYFADEFDLDTTPGSLLLRTYNAATVPIVPYEKQKIKLTNILTLFTSRKREWSNKQLTTYAGIYNPMNKNAMTAPAIVCKTDNYELKNNTHGLVFIKTKVKLFDSVTKFNSKFKILNGSFSDMKSYNEISKYIRQIVETLKILSVGAKTCRDIVKKNSEYMFNDLIRIYDYNRTININEPGFKDKLILTDEQLFAGRPSTALPLSAIIYKCLKNLAYYICSSRFTLEELEILSLSCNSNSNSSNINSNDNSNNDGNNVESINTDVNTDVITNADNNDGDGNVVTNDDGNVVTNDDDDVVIVSVDEQNIKPINENGNKLKRRRSDENATVCNVDENSTVDTIDEQKQTTDDTKNDNADNDDDPTEAKKICL